MLSAAIVALHPSGFEVRLQVPTLDALDEVIAQLHARGFRPKGGAGDGWQRTPGGEPICPRHQVVMAKREKQGDSWFSHRIEVPDPNTGELYAVYCRGYGTVEGLP